MLNIIENFIPVPIPVPGIKLGLANIVTLVTILFFGLKEAILVVILRTLLAQLLVGSLSTFLYSIIGGLLSAVIMYIVYNYFNKYFSLVGVSVFGSVAHNIGQLLVAALVINNFLIFSYFPILMLSAIAMGIFTGFASNFLSGLIKKSMKYVTKW